MLRMVVRWHDTKKDAFGVYVAFCIIRGSNPGIRFTKMPV
ncbi:Hypothetical protein FORC64_p020 (plasmid) [Escherichia coli]|nr:Hypothetical protein FORC64_p020 [Escherichia coli]